MTPAVELCFGCMEARDPSGFCPHCGYRHGTLPTSPLYLKPGTLLQEQYIVGRVLGHGGFGVTYLGFDSILQRKIALKEYLPSSLATRQTESAHLSVHYEQLRSDFDFGLQRFLEEARTLARFHGIQNIIWVMNFFSANGTAYMEMEYLEGETFECYLGRNNGRISFAAARAILMPVMDALREIHKQNILHRDISPDNIFLVNKGPVKLLDFGAARQAMSMRNQGLSVIVKEGYAPEEQYSSKVEQGPWTDVYALAGTMYRAITGHIPALSLERRLTGDLTLPSLLGSDIPPESEPILMRALAIDAADRYRTVEEFQSALAAVSGVGLASTVRRQTQETQMLDHEHALKSPPVFVPAVPVAPPVITRPTVPVPTATPSTLPMRGIMGTLLLIGLGYAGYRGLTKSETAALEVMAFSAKDGSVAAGASTTLSWQVSHADRVFIVPEPGQVGATGSAQVTPKETTSYHLTALGPDGKSVDKVVQVIVLPSGVNPSKPEPFPPVESAQPPSAPVVPPTAFDPTLVPSVSGANSGGSATSSAAEAPVADASKNQFLVFHQHGGLGGIVGHGKDSNFTGLLEVKDDRITYRSTSQDQRGDDFDQPLSAIAEARKNRLPLQGKQAFHIRFKNGQNYNFEPRNTSVEAILSALPQKHGK